MATTVGPPEIEIIDPLAAFDGDNPADALGVAYEPPPPRPSRLEPALRQAERLERRLDSTIFRLGRHRAINMHGNVRRDSRVRQHIWVPYDRVRQYLPTEGSELRAGRTRLTLSPFAPAPKGALRAEGHLRLAASWPRLPVEVTVEPWWRNRTIATMALRRRRRWRYPRRYFAAAHSTMRRLADHLGGCAVQDS